MINATSNHAVIAIEDILQSSCSVCDGKWNDQAMQWIPPNTSGAS